MNQVERPAKPIGLSVASESTAIGKVSIDVEYLRVDEVGVTRQITFAISPIFNPPNWPPATDISLSLPRMEQGPSIGSRPEECASVIYGGESVEIRCHYPREALTRAGAITVVWPKDPLQSCSGDHCILISPSLRVELAATPSEREGGNLGYIQTFKDFSFNMRVLDDRLKPLDSWTTSRGSLARGIWDISDEEVTKKEPRIDFATAEGRSTIRLYEEQRAIFFAGLLGGFCGAAAIALLQLALGTSQSDDRTVDGIRHPQDAGGTLLVPRG